MCDPRVPWQLLHVEFDACRRVRVVHEIRDGNQQRNQVTNRKEETLQRAIRIAQEDIGAKANRFSGTDDGSDAKVYSDQDKTETSAVELAGGQSGIRGSETGAEVVEDTEYVEGARQAEKRIE